MTLALSLGALVGFGVVGIIYGLCPAPPSLQSIVDAMNGSRLSSLVADDSGSRSQVIGRSLASRLITNDVTNHPRWEPIRQNLSLTGDLAENVASKILVGMGAGLVGPPLLWVLATQTAGVELSPVVPVVMALVAVPAGACLPVLELQRRARDRRRHFRVVISSFVDLVVLGLAGGVGVEGALFAASQMSGDWAARRMSRALAKARDSGQSPWGALGELGDDVGVPELIELSSTLELAGTEGARVRPSLQARAVSFRRHEQADAESAANSATERLFLPGTLLLVGFLLFIGYPAFSRVIGGF
jgi:Flp pilus assembly protein TadB